MSKMIDGDYDFTCPKCGKKIKKKIRSLDRNFDCPSCGTTFDAKELKKGFASVDKSIEDLQKTLRKAFK